VGSTPECPKRPAGLGNTKKAGFDWQVSSHEIRGQFPGSHGKVRKTNSCLQERNYWTPWMEPFAKPQSSYACRWRDMFAKRKKNATGARYAIFFKSVLLRRHPDYVSVSRRATLFGNRRILRSPATISAQRRCRSELKNVDGGRAKSELGEYLRPIGNAAQRRRTKCLVRHNNRVSWIQTQLLESAAAPKA